MDIAPHMSPDDVPENLWLQVSENLPSHLECHDGKGRAVTTLPSRHAMLDLFQYNHRDARLVGTSEVRKV